MSRSSQPTLISDFVKSRIPKEGPCVMSTFVFLGIFFQWVDISFPRSLLNGQLKNLGVIGDPQKFIPSIEIPVSFK